MKINRLKLIASVIFALGFLSAQGQGLFVRVGGGFNMALAPENVVNSTETGVTSDRGVTVTTTTLESVNRGYGQSINLGLRVGYMFSEYVGADLGLNYHIGLKQERTETESAQSKDASSSRNTSYKSSLSTFMLTPSFILSTSQEGKIVPYVRAGVAIGIPTSFMDTYTSNSSNTIGTQTKTSTAEGEAKTTASVGIGMCGGVGVDIHLGDKFGVYGEVNFLAMRFTPSESEITKATVDGKDMLANATTRTKKTVFESKITTKSDDASPSQDQPQTAIATPVNYNFVGLNVGVKLRF